MSQGRGQKVQNDYMGKGKKCVYIKRGKSDIYAKIPQGFSYTRNPKS